MMRIVDALLSIPTLFLALVVVAIVHPPRTILILVIALTSWLTTSRLVRGEALSLRVREYVQAMKVMGGGGARAVAAAHRAQRDRDDHGQRHLPGGRRHRSCRRPELPGAGRPAPEQDWGGMLSNGVQYVYDGYWWLIFPAGLAIIIVITAAIFIGDGLRDAVEVRLQRR